jgi:hypothetical protein
MDDEFKRHTYSQLEKQDKRISKVVDDTTALKSKMDSHIEIAKIVEIQDHKNYSEIKVTLKELQSSVNAADYVKKPELESALKPINERLKNTVSLTNLIVVMSACTAVITAVMTIMAYVRPPPG